MNFVHTNGNGHVPPPPAAARAALGRTASLAALLRTLRAVRASNATGRPIPPHHARRLFLRTAAELDLSIEAQAHALALIDQYYRRRLPASRRGRCADL
jgi:hypothetical protein